MEILKNIVNEIKENPTNTELWLKYGQVAAENNQWKTSVAGYLAALILDKNETTFQNFTLSHSQYSNSKDLDSFSFEVFRLPKKTIIVNLLGIINMEVQDLENSIKSILQKHPAYIVLDFTYVKNVTGLGPSTIKKIVLWSQEENVNIAVTSLNDDNKHIFQLKKIQVQEYPNILLAFQNFK